MFTAIDKALRHPVVSSVVAAGIVAAVSSVFGWWETIGDAAKFALNAAALRIPVPAWVLSILLLLALIAVAGIAMRLFSSTDNTVSWQQYVEDSFFGLRWRWKYYSNGALDTPVPFCPCCDYQILPAHSGRYGPPGVRFRCENCNETDIYQDAHLEDVNSQVERQIQRKIRNGEWKNA